MNDQKNTLLAIVLSALVLIGWQIFFGMPQVEKQKQAAQQQQQQQQTQPIPSAPPGTAMPQTQPGGAQALSRLRPRARRAASTLRPPLVAMRARKP